MQTALATTSAWPMENQHEARGVGATTPRAGTPLIDERATWCDSRAAVVRWKQATPQAIEDPEVRWHGRRCISPTPSCCRSALHLHMG